MSKRTILCLILFGLAFILVCIGAYLTEVKGQKWAINLQYVVVVVLWTAIPCLPLGEHIEDSSE